MYGRDLGRRRLGHVGQRRAGRCSATCMGGSSGEEQFVDGLRKRTGNRCEDGYLMGPWAILAIMEEALLDRLRIS